LDAKNNITTNHCFSNRPANGFNDYYEKVTSYIRVISSQAQAIDENVKAQTFKAIESIDTDYVFKYVDTNSSRAEINTISSKLENLKVAIIGAGGTGSYVLDFVAKTPVKEIHLFDGDVFFYITHLERLGRRPLSNFYKSLKRQNIFTAFIQICTSIFSLMRSILTYRIWNN